MEKQPLLFHLAVTPVRNQGFPPYEYDPWTETARGSAETASLEATKSYITDAHGDPTRDESTDR
jgi:hypothetical protein